jgi:uncharacterized protein
MSSMFHESPPARRFTLSIILLIGLILVFSLAGSLVMLLVQYLFGFDATSLYQMASLQEASGRNTLRYVLMFSHLTMFVLPGLAFGWIIYKQDWVRGLGFEHTLTIRGIWISMLSILALYPFVIWTYSINKLLQLPEFLQNMEERTAELTASLVVMQSLDELLLNLVVIALIPAIGEELIFRGILQRKLGYIIKNYHVVIWIGAIIFSAIHMQFGGFLPRMVLGLILGYLFYFSGNLWVPILAHIFNNGFQLIVHYSFQLQMTEIDLEADPAMPVYYALLSLCGSLLLLWYFYRSRKGQFLPKLIKSELIDEQS